MQAHAHVGERVSCKLSAAIRHAGLKLPTEFHAVIFKVAESVPLYLLTPHVLIGLFKVQVILIKSDDTVSRHTYNHSLNPFLLSLPLLCSSLSLIFISSFLCVLLASFFTFL
jgi:hypothetical protein